MESKTTKTSILQGICATLIFTSYLLPWIQVSIIEETSSLVEVILRITQRVHDVSDFSSQMFRADFSGAEVLFKSLFLVPIFAFANMIIQWVWNAPRLAFYLNLIPVGICVALIANAVKLDIDISAFTGIGFYITFIAGIISVLAAWTTIGLHYYCSYKRYMKILTYCILISIGISFVSAILISLSYKLYEFKAGMILSMILMFLSGILGAISFLHFPFVVYAWIIVLFTKDFQKKVLSTVNEAVEMVEPEQEKTVEPNRFCPQCQKTMEPDWNTCPYCGHNPEDAEKKKQEEDDLRFAPPQCQNNR